MKPLDLGYIIRLSNEYAKSLSLVDLWREFGKGLFNQNNKTEKQLEGSDYINYGLELIPAVLLSSFSRSKKLKTSNFCPNYTNDCLLNCLYFSGFQANIMFHDSIFNGQLSPTMKKRIRRSVLFLLDPKFFYQILHSEIKYLFELNWYKKKTPYFRLNVFSDIDFRPFIQSLSPIYSFYDYTKDWKRASLLNYDLTFSASEKTSDSEILEKLSSKENVAIIFDRKALPSEHLGYPVIDGDITDNRYLDKKGVVIGLRRKTTLKRKELN